MTKDFSRPRQDDPGDQFRYIDSPLKFNHIALAEYPQEVMGFHLLEAMRKRLGWSSYENKVLLDLGCGVRFAQTIYNLNLEIGLYIGVDVQKRAIEWLSKNLIDPKLSFHHVDTPNLLYNPNGSAEAREDLLSSLDMPPADLACMFSVITHQEPDEAALTFRQLHKVTKEDSSLYFTAFIDRKISRFKEQQEDRPGMLSTYNPDLLVSILSQTGWKVLRYYDATFLQQTAFICSRV